MTNDHRGAHVPSSDGAGVDSRAATLLKELLEQGFTLTQIAFELEQSGLAAYRQIWETLTGTYPGDEYVEVLDDLVTGRRKRVPLQPPAPSRGVRRGRPPVGAPGGESPVVKGRVTHEEYSELKAIMAETDRGQADLVRRGVQLVIAEHHALRAARHLSNFGVSDASGIVGSDDAKEIS